MHDWMHQCGPYCCHAMLCCAVQELADALHLLESKAADEAAAAAGDRRRLEGVAKSLEGRLAQASLQAQAQHGLHTWNKGAGGH
jgi:hypothetical protein